MKILHLIPRFVISDEGILVGSAANSLRNLIHYTSKDIISEVYTHIDQNMKANLYRLGLNGTKFHIGENWIQPHSMTYGAWFFIRGFWAIIRHRAWGADIIHGHSGYPLYGLLTALTAKVLKKPSLHTLYCPLLDTPQASGYKYIFNRTWISHFSLLFNDRILAISENVRKSIIKFGVPIEKVYVVPPVVNLNRFHPKLRSEKLRTQLGTKSEEPIILYVGNLRSWKGLDTLIEALGLLVVEELSFRFVITLDDVINTKVNQILRRFMEKVDFFNLSNRTVQLRFVSNMPELMASSDILIIPFRHTEGPSDYPMALLEGMASGISIVATNVGGIPELVENNKNGILVEPDSPVTLAHALKTLLINKNLRQSMGNISRKKIEDKFCLDTIMKLFLEIYQALLT